MELALIIGGVIIILLLAALIVLVRKNAGGRNAAMAELLKQMGDETRRSLADGFAANRSDSEVKFAVQSDLIRKALTDQMSFLMEFRNTVAKAESESTAKLTESQHAQSDRMARNFTELSAALDDKITKFKTAIGEENKNFRQEQQNFQTLFQQGVNQQLEKNRDSVDLRLKELQKENAARLDEMKKTVDEKLQQSVEKHFNESFKLISERLEQVHKGLGEMQTLASGVGDLKKVLSNVKARGNLGEIQLAVLLDEYLAPDQYLCNVSTVPGSSEVVEFAIKMPGKKEEESVLLPIDSKFPVEDYRRLQESFEKFPRMSQELKKAQEAFARTVRKCAEDIRSKYLYPPRTTAFGMMFVPSEGLYAEILRLPGLFDELRNDKIVVVGPSNLVAFLNALQMGFKTLAIEKRSSEVWEILGAVKSEFSKFGEEMEATQRSLQAVCNHVERIGTRSRAMERKLRNVQELPPEEAAKLIPTDSDDADA